MSLKYKLFAIIFFLLTFSISVSLIVDNQQLKKKNEPVDYMFMQRAYPSGKINTGALKQILDWKKHKRQNNKKLVSSNWEFIGPNNIGGRITDIEIAGQNTYYVGAASGGVFKTTNGGTTWQPVFDNQEMLSIGDIAISNTNNNLLYVGTGEVNAGGGSLAYDGNGIYKSADAGATWTHKGLGNVGSISKILINPQNNDILYAGAMGHLFSKDDNRGVYKSIDGGNTWNKMLFVSDSTGVIDMAINPTNPNIVYAATWERIRRVNYNRYYGATSRIYRSQDAGVNWVELTNGLPSIPTQKGRISIDISQSNPSILYASYTDSNGNIQGIYKTTDGGNTWTNVTTVQQNAPYNWWFGGVFIDPADVNHIFYAGFTMAQTTDACAHWYNVQGLHVDQHTVAFNSQNAQEILIGNDGGLYKSINGGATFSKINNLPITQFYHLVVDPQNDQKIYGGAQDNNTVRTVTGLTSDWHSIYIGDGMQSMVDPTNSNTIYAMYQYGHLARSVNDGNSFQTILSGINPGEKKNWNTPVCMDPSNANILYFGAEKVYKTTNRGSNWTAFSAKLTGLPANNENLTYHTISSIDVSPLNSNIVYAGTDDGKVWVSDTPNGNWHQINTGLPDLWVTRIKASPSDEHTVYITFSGYRFGANTGHIFKSVDTGANWTDISGNLPDIPVNDIEIDDFGNLFVATDAGVMASADQGATWQPVENGMPSVVVTDLYYNQTNKYLYAATFGRSAYRIDLNQNILNVSGQYLTTTFKVYPNPADFEVNIHFNDDNRPKQISVTDLQGKQMLLTYNITGHNQIKVNTSRLPEGIYILTYEGIKSELRKKIVVRHL